MKFIQTLVIAVTALVLTSTAALAGSTTLKFKVGDTAYVCGCGEKCECLVLSKKAGKCSCSHDMVKVTINKVKGKTVSYELSGKEHSASLKAKYTCGCEGDCCQFISQKAGKCPCGKDLTKVDKKEKKKAKKGTATA